jgi:hypothetical protein
MFAVKRLNGKFFTDTAYGKVKSLRGNVGSQLFSAQVWIQGVLSSSED